MQWFSAEFAGGVWGSWQYGGDELKQNEYEVGKLHITADGQELYFHSPRDGGYGGLDLWASQKKPAGWGEPVNLEAQVNTTADEGWPYISVDGRELWYTGQSTLGHPGPAIFRSFRQPDGTWGVMEEIISSFAGEPTVSGDGKTLYFVHHIFSEDISTMLDADIYISHRMEP